MSTLQFKRSPRQQPPRPPGGEVHLEPPPEIPRLIPGSMIQKILPFAMVAMSLGMVAYMVTSKNGGGPQSIIFGGMMVMSTVGMLAGGGGGKGGGQQKAEMNEDRKDYLRYLAQMRERARESADEQRKATEWSHPEPRNLWTVAASRRMWERRQNDPDFCHLRVGLGSQRLATRLVPPQTGPVDELEPLATLALRRFVRAHSIVDRLPIAISLKGFAAVAINGEREQVRGVARAMISQLATFHTPDDVLICLVSQGRAREQWEWLKWLPHTQSPRLVDGIGSQRLMASSLSQLENELLDAELIDRPRFQRGATLASDQPHIVIIIDEGQVSREERIVLEDGLVGVTLLDLSDSLGKLAAKRGLRLVSEDNKIGARSGTGVEWFGAPDSLSAVEAESLARRLAPFRMGGSVEASDDEPLTSAPTMLELLNIPGDPMTFDIAEAWRPRPIRDRYNVEFGIGEHGQAVKLDIKEAAEGGMGPHGLCIGATGSGKSEFLRTLVLAMIATHSSATLNFVLVDFKGGATFLGLDKAPHVSTVITNLEGQATLVNRMYDALDGEMARRQEKLAEVGAKNVWDYQKKIEKGAPLEPLPALFIVVDEFSELLASQPEFIELFVMIGRLGRSLQVHMLLASQRLEEGKLRGLDSHLRYRIGLKTFSASESRAAIGVPDAFELPSIPGSGYLALDGTMTRFKAAYVSGAYKPSGIANAQVSAPISDDRMPKLFVPEYVDLPPEPEKPVVIEEEKPKKELSEEEKTEQSELGVIVRRASEMKDHPKAHQVWLPPLEFPTTLDVLYGTGLQVTPDRGLSPVGYHGNGQLNVPIGRIDIPFYQRQDNLMVSLDGATGHAAVVGGPQTGKSMLLRTLIVSMALTHTPQEAQFYLVDLGGGSMSTLEGLPHVGGYAGRRDIDTVRRSVSELVSLLTAREELFRRLRIESMADFRARKRRGEIQEDKFGDVFLVIDGWKAFRDDFETVEPQVLNLVNQGLSFGIHVILSATQWAQIRPAVKDLIGTRLELRLGDPTESEIDRRTAVFVPEGAPGRGLTRDKLHFLTGVPRIDSLGFEKESDVLEDLGGGIQKTVAQIANAWQGPRAPQVRLLPDNLPLENLPQPAQQPNPKLVPIGVNEDELAPVYLDFQEDPHFVAFMDGESGKTNLLRSIVKGITARYTPKEALFLLVDYRFTMLGLLTDEYQIGYATNANQIPGMVADIRTSMLKRLPSNDITPDQLRNRSWWTGPDLFVIVDDYDLVVTQSGNPLQPLSDLLAQGKQIGLHLIVARRTGGASKSLYDPIVGKLKELSTSGFVGSGAKDEGALVGNVKPSAQQPGRGTIVTRKRGEERMQIAWSQPQQ
ncbi:type VII secretion protein EccCa [Pseudonocardiaceae bacterium YIM PH 21723]|nr:type VII secretion protein EccCa [Pseudonocardiaceae bacterium YIM PH 21723]